MAANEIPALPHSLPEFIVEPSETPTSTQTDNTAIERERMIAELQVPFDPSLVKWRAFDFKWQGGTLYGRCFPYVDPRGYEDRLNQVCKPEGWSHQSQPSFSGNKVVVSCVVFIEGLGSHSKLGEDWAQDENGATAAEAQAFKRACACFGLGRYLYHFNGVWLPLNTDKRPINPPPLPEFATPEGWRQGLRPKPEIAAVPTATTSEIPGRAAGQKTSQSRSSANCPVRHLKNVMGEIRAMRSPLGASLYSALLKSIGQARRPSEIRDVVLQHRVLQHMQSARRGLIRLRKARSLVGNNIYRRVMVGLELNSMTDIRDLRTLQAVVLALEGHVQANQK